MQEAFMHVQQAQSNDFSPNIPQFRVGSTRAVTAFVPLCLCLCSCHCSFKRLKFVISHYFSPDMLPIYCQNCPKSSCCRSDFVTNLGPNVVMRSLIGIQHEIHSSGYVKVWHHAINMLDFDHRTPQTRYGNKLH